MAGMVGVVMVPLSRGLGVSRSLLAFEELVDDALGLVWGGLSLPELRGRCLGRDQGALATVDTAGVEGHLKSILWLALRDQSDRSNRKEYANTSTAFASSSLALECASSKDTSLSFPILSSGLKGKEIERGSR